MTRFRSGRMRERRVFASPFTRQRETHDSQQQLASVVSDPADMALRTGTTYAEVTG